MRGLVAAVLAVGLLIQAVGVAFDYTAMAHLLGHKPIFSQENYLWDPQFNHVRFNLHLMDSVHNRRQTVTAEMPEGQPLPFVYERHYLPVTVPDPLPPDEVYVDRRGLDRLDLWYLQQARDWPGQAYWFKSLSSYLAVILLLVGLAACGGLVWLGRRETRMQ